MPPSRRRCCCWGSSPRGCGGGGVVGGSDDNAALPLTKWLPTDAETYTAVDLSALREDLELDEEEDPLDVSPTTPFALASDEALGALYEYGNDPSGSIFYALDLGNATGLASSGQANSVVTAVATSADTGEIGSALGDIGYRERDGVLTYRGAMTHFKLDIGLIFAAHDPALLRAIPDDPRDDVPDPLLEELDGSFSQTEPPDADAGCLLSQGASGQGDGSGEVAFLVDGEADAESVREGSGYASELEIGEADADDDIAAVEVTPAEDADLESGFAAVDALRAGAVEYAC